ncbi:recombinase family protein [Dehalococcoidia bacterium]|nr:recombinase family protein [Dehalococcoidia bacterium]
MKTVAVYCRVSTDDQEKEGTSLQTQFQACLKYCQERGYEMAYRFSEAYSGLTLERPKLNELRELIRNEEIDVVVVYCLDRLSRDPAHGVILTQELEKHHVTLEAVTEDVDNSELGKLITYIRGFASKLEAEKIRERTTRGRKAKAQQGKIPGGGFARTYGYDYVRATDKCSGRRVVNEFEARWVKQIYEWLVNDRMSCTGISKKLNTIGVPTKRGKYWAKQTVLAILQNLSYTGKTYAFTTIRGKGAYSKPQEEWVDIPGVTPSIIDEAMFEAAQKQLRINGQRSPRNAKRQYLLNSHIFCRKCSRAYYGFFNSTYVKGKRYEKRRYRCSGSLKTVTPFQGCHNKSWSADTLESMVWQQIERVLDKPELIITEIEKQRQDAKQLGVLETELQHVECQLKALRHEQEQLLQWALKGFPEELVVSENKRINNKRNSLEIEKAELEAQIKASQEASLNLPKLERFVELIRQKLTMLDYDTKRLALDMLNIKVWIDGYDVEITGTLPIVEDAIATMQPIL